MFLAAGDEASLGLEAQELELIGRIEEG